MYGGFAAQSSYFCYCNPYNMVILQTLFLFLLAYYGLKLLAKWLVPKLLSYAVKKSQERFKTQYGGDSAPYKVGKTTIVQKSRRSARPTKKVGEYIDFEEID